MLILKNIDNNLLFDITFFCHFLRKSRIKKIVYLQFIYILNWFDGSNQSTLSLIRIFCKLNESNKFKHLNLKYQLTSSKIIG